MSFYKETIKAIKNAIATVPEMVGADLTNILVEMPKNREFGDFSTNAALVLTKQLGRPPRAIAELIMPVLAKLPFTADVTIAGPGFVNIKLRDDYIAGAASVYTMPAGTDTPWTIDMDYGSYNVAKSLHIGHLRGSIVGDTFYRIAEFLGHKPVSYNHMGDWGKPMALVIGWIIKKFPNEWNAPDFEINVDEVNEYYPAASAYSKENPAFLERVLIIKKEFQDGRPDYFALYEKMLKISLEQMSDVVKRLNMRPFNNNLGERNAANYLGPVEKILRDKNLIQRDDGAEIIVLKRNDDRAPMPPFMWTDSRGADTYDSTDLATVYYRKITDNPDRILYFSDHRQQLHFAQLFRATALSGIYPSDQMEFPYFGSINGADVKPYKTRSGSVAGLLDMIKMTNDAVRERVRDAGKNLDDDTIDMIGLAALKFNDLMHDVKSDYVFDPDAVTSFEGRTGPYILYTAVRLNSILKKSSEFISSRQGYGRQEVQSAIHSDLATVERDLLLTILDFDRTINRAFDTRATDVLANYTYDLAQGINTFYHHCPILADGVDDAMRTHRLGIVRLALMVLSKCIELMGLKIPDEM